MSELRGRHPDLARYLEDLPRREPNLDLTDRGRFTAANGWQIDDHCQSLPREPPGDPLPDGSWEIGRRLMHDYEFADPEIVRAVYDPDRPLEERNFLLIAHYAGLVFHLGCRVGRVIDEIRTAGDGPVRVWGWNYHTLAGHLEMGEMTFEIWKHLRTGQVEFRIHAFSRAAKIRNPIIRLGLRLFGRRVQLRFARNACRRVYELTCAELDRKADRPPAERPPPPAAKSLITEPAARPAEPPETAEPGRPAPG